MFRRRAAGSRADAPVSRSGPGHGLTAAGPPVGSGLRSAAAAAAAAAGAEPAGRDPGGTPPPGLDVATAHPARVWNYWLGGRDYYAADRAAGERLNREFPHLAQTARAERAFLVRAVRFLAGPARIRQFLDIGAGLPAGGNTHEIAQRIAPEVGIVYADNDPAVLVHARALLQNPMLASTPEGAVSYVDADLRDVTAVLAGAARTLDLGQPVALIMLGVLGHVDNYGAARSITSQLMDALPTGSYLAVGDGVAGSGAADEAQHRYNDGAAVPYHLRRPDQLASFFDGLDLVEPGVVPCSRWKPDASGAPGALGAPGAPGALGAGAGPADEAAVYCGVARKP
jgi:O-methyltransferase involved in polyketide biosynthesis